MTVIPGVWAYTQTHEICPSIIETGWFFLGNARSFFLGDSSEMLGFTASEGPSPRSMLSGQAIWGLIKIWGIRV